MADPTPLDTFKAVLGGAARAMAREPELELSYTAEAPSVLGKAVRVPMPGRALPADQVAEARGFADGYALRLRHHDQGLHDRTAPARRWRARCMMRPSRRAWRRSARGRWPASPRTFPERSKCG